MVRLANKQITELWGYLSQGYEVLVHSADGRQPISSVSQVSPRYKNASHVDRKCVSITIVAKYS